MILSKQDHLPFLQDADVKIGQPSSSYGDTPHTIQTGGCGQPGDFIHMTPNYVKNIDSSTSIDKYGPSGTKF